MTTPHAPQRDAAAPDDTPPPRAVVTLMSKLADWDAELSRAVGPCEFNALSEETDGEGRHSKITVTEDVDSVCVRAAHEPTGRALVALWIRRPSRKSWTLETAWRGAWPWEPTPTELTATELAAYVVDEPPTDPRIAEQLALDLAELAEHRARWEANRDVWVPIPQAWSTIPHGSVFLDARGAPWTLVSVTPAQAGPIVRACHGAQEYAGQPAAPTALVLVPVPERDALTLSRAVLGSRIMERESA
jgi:hypothetical protein